MLARSWLAENGSVVGMVIATGGTGPLADPPADQAIGFQNAREDRRCAAT